MNKLLLYTSFIICLCFLNGCKKDKLKDEKNILVGKWEWTSSSATINLCNPPTSDIVITPFTENVDYSIEFQEKGKVIFYTNDVETEKYRIAFTSWTISDYVEPYDYMFYIDLNNDEDKSMYGVVKQDSLLIFNSFHPFYNGGDCDYYWNRFVKE
jgi:hypothetical protein